MEILTGYLRLETEEEGIIFINPSNIELVKSVGETRGSIIRLTSGKEISTDESPISIGNMLGRKKD